MEILGAIVTIDGWYKVVSCGNSESLFLINKKN